MSFNITSRKFYDEFTGTGGGGVNYLNACQGDKIKCVIEGYFYWAATLINVSFDAGTKTITQNNLALGVNNSFIERGFNAGDTIAVIGTASNNATFTIASLTDTTITTVEVLVSEVAPSTSIYGTTLITSIDLLYDLIDNLSKKSDFVSATDKETVQRYYATGLDASVITPVPMKIGSESFGWVTDIVTGDEGEAIVEGVGISNYKQYFKITHVFYMTRIWTNELIQNFANRLAPNEYLKGNHLKHICKINGKFDYYDPIIVHTGSLIDQKGSSAWFNQSNVQDKSEYSINSIQYQNFATSEYLEQLDGSIVNLVTMTINSRSGKFVAATTKFILNHFLCPTKEIDYINTNTTLLQNIRLDKKIITMDAVAVNGIEYSTDYQSLTDIQATYVSATQVIITFKVDYSSATKTILANKDADDRLYAFVISCQDIAITTTKNIDRVNVLADFKGADYDLRTSALFSLIDYIHCYPFPNYGVFEANEIVGYEGDLAYIEIPFQVETAIISGASPTLQKMNIQIVATKDGENDFILEEKAFDLSAVRKLNDKQTINDQTTRGMILPDESPWNRANVIRYEDGDDGTMAGYKLQYGFVLRYESWIEVVQSALGASFDVFKDIETVVQAWKRYSTGNGWALKFRLNAEVLGYSDFVTKFQTETTFTILEAGDAPEDGPTYKSQIKFYNEIGTEVPGLIKEEPTRIVATFFGDPTDLPAGMTVINGFVTVDNEFGSMFTRRIATTDFDSEEDSPFSTEDLPALQNVVSEMQSANLRMAVYNNRVVFDTWYTPDITTSPENKKVSFRLGYNVASILLQEDGSAIMQDGSYILLNL